MKTVIEMALAAGIEFTCDPTETPPRAFVECWIEELERFAALARADEREACAKVLDKMAEDMVREMEPSSAIAYVRSKAAAIRARGNT